MRKQFSILLMFVMIMFLVMRVEAGVLSADTNLTVGVEGINIGTFWNAKENQLLAGATMPVISYKDLVGIGVGAVSDFSNVNIPLVSVDINVQNACELFGLQYKFLEPLLVGAFYSRDLNKVFTGEAKEYYGIYWAIVKKF